MKTSIIIPIFNGSELIKANLPKVLECGADEVIVADDASSDDSVAVLKTFNDRITLIANKKNLGYGENLNNAIKQANGEIIVLLNSDVAPEKDFLKPLIPYFSDNSVFAVSCHEPGQSWEWGGFVNGFVDHHAMEESNESHISIYASGGSAAFSKEKFLKLGLYDTLYYPFYWEDFDMSYRAWKRGWKVFWEPKSIIHHERSATIKKHFKKNYISQITQRNELLFIWKNITDKDLFEQHKKALTNRILNHPGYLKVLLDALKYRNQVNALRYKEIKESVKTDKEIFELFAK
jgi:O-antigen biosynthesis protein